MQKWFSNRGVVALLVVVALGAGVALGGLLFAKSTEDSPSAEADAASSSSSAPTSSIVDPATGDSLPPGSDARPDGPGATNPGVAPAASDPVPGEPGPLVVVEPANAPSYAYQESERGQQATGTVPPPTLPVKVSMTSTKNLVDGQPVGIRIEANPDSEIYGFEARICTQDSTFRGLYDFFPTVTGTCAATALSPTSSEYLRVEGQAPYDVAEGSMPIGLGASTFTTEDDRQVTVRCDKNNPCKLVLMIQVPYGFGFQEFPLSYA